MPRGPAARLTACFVHASAHAQAAPASIWRLDGTNLAVDRELISACLRQADRSCENVVQQPCLEAAEETGPTTVAMQQCYARAIAAWEDEMLHTLARLETQVSATRRQEVEGTQRAWEASMLADVGLVMGVYEGGSLWSLAHRRTPQRQLSGRCTLPACCNWVDREGDLKE